MTLYPQRLCKNKISSLNPIHYPIENKISDRNNIMLYLKIKYSVTAMRLKIAIFALIYQTIGATHLSVDFSRMAAIVW